MDDIKSVELIDINKIDPNPFNARTSFNEDMLKEMAKTISKVGLLQPISVRLKNSRYELIQGERRWRAAKLAGMKKIPAIVKDVDDKRAMMESLIENVQREDLTPIEKAKGLAEVYRSAGFKPAIAALALGALRDIESGHTKREPTEEELRLKEIADMVGLSYDYQYKLLTQLRLTKAEQKLVSELGLASDKISSIATIEKPEIRKKIIEIAPSLPREEVTKLSKIAKEAPESSPVVKAVLKPKPKITPRVAEKLLELPEKKQKEAIATIESLRLTEEEAIAYIESLKVEIPPPSKEEIEAIQRRHKELVNEIEETIKRPEVKRRGKLFKNWLSHVRILERLPEAFCPIHEENSGKLVWSCCGLTVEEAEKKAGEKFELG